MNDPSTIWSYAAPGDRETLTAAGIAWLMDPNGSHGLGAKILEHFAERAGLSTSLQGNVEIRLEDSPSRDKRFDIAVFSEQERILIVEVKCKTFGYLSQLDRYQESQDSSVGILRCGFAEWNWVDLEEREGDFPLITLKEIGEKVNELASQHSISNTTCVEFAKHLIDETEFLQSLLDYFLQKKEVSAPQLLGSFQYSQRFLNQLYWRFIIKKGKNEWPHIFNNCDTKTEQSGVWCTPFWKKIEKEENLDLPGLGIQIEGPLSFWTHIEFFNRAGILSEADQAVGNFRLCLANEGERRGEVLEQFYGKRDELEKKGWSFPGRRPSASSWSYTILRRSMTIEDFRFHNLVKRLEELLSPA